MDVLVKCFADSDIVKGFSSKRTKAITYNGLKPEFEKNIIQDLHRIASHSGILEYLIIINESTNVDS